MRKGSGGIVVVYIIRQQTRPRLVAGIVSKKCPGPSKRISFPAQQQAAVTFLEHPAAV